MEYFLRYLPILLFSLLIMIWIYFFIHSYLYQVDWPWGFSILFVTVLVPRYSLTYYSDEHVFFSIDPWFALVLIYLLINVNGIQELLVINNFKKILNRCLLGLLFGVLSGILLMSVDAMKFIQGGSEYTPFALLFASVQSSVTEELLFRGFLLGYFVKFRLNPYFAILLQALIFTSFHISSYLDNWTILIVVFLIGITTGYMTWKNNNLLPAFCIHIVANLFAVAWRLLFILPR
jgi:membrane protease YdiL (CAAX protease family)